MPSDVALSRLRSYDDLMTALHQLGYGNVDDVVTDLDHLLGELRVDKRKPIPPDDYLCHVCFQKGHYIKDCPQVRWMIASSFVIACFFERTVENRRRFPYCVYSISCVSVRRVSRMLARDFTYRARLENLQTNFENFGAQQGRLKKVVRS